MEDDFDHGFYADMSFSEIVGLPPAVPMGLIEDFPVDIESVDFSGDVTAGTDVGSWEDVALGDGFRTIFGN